MCPAQPRYQFSLRILFLWMLAISVQLALIASLPWPFNGYFAPLFASLLAGCFGSRSPWLAVLLGGLSCMTAGILVAFMETQGQPSIWQTHWWSLPWLMPCCSFPLGAYIGLAIGTLIRERRRQRRFKNNLEALYAELSSERPTASEVSTPPESDSAAD